jgi:AcrR family transcriptional regulator
MTMAAGDRPLRADARRNRERVLNAARDVFAESGFDASLDEIAGRAGVGIGTVYRAFPTKEALFGAVANARVADLVAEADRRADDPDPGAAFFGFLARVGAEGAAKRDMPEAITVSGAVQDELYRAMAVLLRRAQDSGAARVDITITDLVALMKGVMTSVRDASDPDLVERVIAVVVDGLRAPGT